MDNITEEKITKNILKWLIENDWNIITYDFPQSGTGKFLHPNENVRKNKTKNSKAFIPDIVAVKNSNAVFFENKNRFYLDDFIKLKNIKENNNYSISINNLLKTYDITNIYFGIGAINNELFITLSKEYINYVDFVILYNEESNDVVVYSDTVQLFNE